MFPGVPGKESETGLGKAGLGFGVGRESLERSLAGSSFLGPPNHLLSSFLVIPA